ncbi:RNA polymerase sigma factor [Aquimarina sp. Aq78]|uniref:RNA polymerase sigma factor n=1 Tax=Aquimarina sp. Aq78 TaxID=1191889 RepID=UPI000D0EEA61|nr:RNA polymerase sigma factor [Aquimarina sp. Aq78]
MENPLKLANYDDSIDEKLITNSKKGDKKSLNKLLNRHQNYIFNIALKMLNNVTDAEDATQEVLIKLITNLAKYDSSKSRFRTWLYRITFNHILNLKKSASEKKELTFTKFFGFMDSVPDIFITEGENTNEIMGQSIQEARIACTAGMLMCLDRSQRLIYIVGEIFKIDHNLASEIFDITPVNFRKKLSRTRKDLHQWMHKKCGLVNENNPCRCRNKTKKFIELGIVNPENPKWLSNYKNKIFEHVESKLDETAINTDEIYSKIYQQDPFKTNMKAKQVYEEILNNKNFARFMDL